jgi:hypothetical protein
MTNFKLFLLLAMLLTGCSPTSRLNRLLTNHPELAKEAVTKEKTVYITEIDTILVPEYKHDTTLLAADTVRFEDDRVSVSIIKKDTLYKVKTVIKPQTLIIHDTIKYTYKDTVAIFEYKPLTFKEKSKYRCQGMLIMLFIILILIILWLIFKQYIKTQIPILRFIK